jgi:cathepsin A (carboxypeptidase C)/serine carboxypeptidase-like clade 2
LQEVAVQRAIHAKVGINWEVCNFDLNGNYVRDDTVLPLYPKLLSKYRAIVYSGDVDSAVNYRGTQEWVNSLGLPVVSPWAPWTTPDGQNAGFVKVFEPLTWLTIRGSGRILHKARLSRACYNIATESPIQSNTSS